MQLRSTAGHAYLLLFSGDLQRVATPFGDWWLDLRGVVPFAQGLQGASGRTDVTLPVANVPALRGLGLGIQGVDFTASTLLFTNALVVVLD